MTSSVGMEAKPECTEHSSSLSIKTHSLAPNQEPDYHSIPSLADGLRFLGALARKTKVLNG